MNNSQKTDSPSKLGLVHGSPPWSEKRKLEAISYRFYQQQAWGADQGRNGPAVGDYYCITRAGLALYRVSRIEEGRVWYASVYNDDGSMADGHEESFTHEDFTRGGFAYARCYCPPWCFLANTKFRDGGDRRPPSP